MDYVLLSPEEAAELLNISSREIIALVEMAELGGLKVAGHWRIPLKSIAHLLSGGAKTLTTGCEARTASASCSTAGSCVRARPKGENA